MRITSHTAVLFSSGSLISLLLSSAAFAQDSGSTERARPELEEIVVTADVSGTEVVQVGSFRGAEVLDTPLTVSVIPKGLIEQQIATSLLDALRNTPGVTSAQTSPTVYNNLSIRGIEVENRVNYRLNGSLPIVNLVDLPLENKARVEALKGASALYYGFTTPSGIINLTTEAPTLEPRIELEALGNDHGGILGRVDVGGTMGIFGARVNASIGSVDSGIDNTRGNRNFQSGRFELRPADGLLFAFDAEHIYKKVTEPTILQIATSATTLPKLVNPSTNPGAEYFYSTNEAVNLLAHASYDLSPAWTISADVGQSRVTRDRNFTRLANFNPLTGVGKLTLSAARGQVYRNRHYRAELAGTFATGPVIHELLIGAAQNLFSQYSPPGAGLAATDCTRIGLPSNCNQSYYSPTPLLPLDGFDANRPYTPSRDTLNNDVGFYAFDRMKFGGPDNELISVLLGGRKSIYKESNAASGQTSKVTPFSFSAGLVLKPVDWVSVYGTFIEGLEATPLAPFSAVNAAEQLGPSQSTQYEAGIKVKPWRNLLLTAAYFDIDRELTYTNDANVFVKDGRATYKGLELSATGDVTRQLSVYISALLLKAKQGETSDPTLIGNRIENTAKASWSVYGNYKLDSLVSGLAIHAGAFHVGQRAINPQNSLFLPGYTTFDLGGIVRDGHRRDGSDVSGQRGECHRKAVLRIDQQQLRGVRSTAVGQVLCLDGVVSKGVVRNCS